jgi:hypothetical protein
MKSKPPVLKGLYRIGNDFAWKVTSPQDHEHEYVFFGSELEAKKIGIKLFTDKGNRPRVRLLGSV